MNRENIEEILKKLGAEDVPADVHKIAEETSEKFSKTLTQSRQHILWSNIMRTRITKFAAAAVIIITVLGGINFWSSDGSGNGKWWLGPPAAWGQEILESLESVKAIVYRQRAFKVRDYGPDTMGSLWERRYAATDKYRSDVYDDSNNIVITQWTLPSGEGYTKYKVWTEYQCYTKKPEKSPPFLDNVMGLLRRYVSFLDRASKILGTEIIEGQECIGFEISPGKYGDFTVTRLTHIWFDVETKLPVRTERRGIETSYDPAMKLTLIHDQFDYYAEAPADMFTLQIPEGFVNAEPDEIIAAKRRLVFADVTEEIKDDIISALKEVQTAAYQEHLEWTTTDGDTHTYGPRNVYLTSDGWREDSSKWETPQKKKWYLLEKKDYDAVSFDFNEQNFRLTETIVNFTDETYSVATYKEDSQQRHPMVRILFLASLVNQADRILENTKIEGTECFGIEVSANKYGDNSPNDKHRMWFDVDTKLPVRMEFEYWQSDGKTKSLKIRDQFQWDPDLDKETFIPVIPEGFEFIEVTDR